MRVFVAVNCATNGSNEIVAAATNVTVTVLGYTIVAANTVSATFKSANNALTGPMSMAVAVPIVSPSNSPVFKTAIGEALNLVLNSNVQVSGHMLVDKT